RSERGRAPVAEPGLHLSRTEPSYRIQYRGRPYRSDRSALLQRRSESRDTVPLPSQQVLIRTMAGPQMALIYPIAEQPVEMYSQGSARPQSLRRGRIARHGSDATRIGIPEQGTGR